MVIPAVPPTRQSGPPATSRPSTMIPRAWISIGWRLLSTSVAPDVMVMTPTGEDAVPRLSRSRYARPVIWERAGMFEVE